MKKTIIFTALIISLLASAVYAAQCNDNIDNDGDGFIDYEDKCCLYTSDDESSCNNNNPCPGHCVGEAGCIAEGSTGYCTVEGREYCDEGNQECIQGYEPYFELVYEGRTEIGSIIPDALGIGDFVLRSSYSRLLQDISQEKSGLWFYLERQDGSQYYSDRILLENDGISYTGTPFPIPSFASEGILTPTETSGGYFSYVISYSTVRNTPGGPYSSEIIIWRESDNRFVRLREDYYADTGILFYPTEVKRLIADETNSNIVYVFVSQPSKDTGSIVRIDFSGPNPLITVLASVNKFSNLDIKGSEIFQSLMSTSYYYSVYKIGTGNIFTKWVTDYASPLNSASLHDLESSEENLYVSFYYDPSNNFYSDALVISEYSGSGTLVWEDIIDKDTLDFAVDPSYVIFLSSDIMVSEKTIAFVFSGYAFVSGSNRYFSAIHLYDKQTKELVYTKYDYADHWMYNNQIKILNGNDVHSTRFERAGTSPDYVFYINNMHIAYKEPLGDKGSCIPLFAEGECECSEGETQSCMNTATNGICRPGTQSCTASAASAGSAEFTELWRVVSSESSQDRIETVLSRDSPGTPKAFAGGTFYDPVSGKMKVMLESYDLSSGVIMNKHGYDEFDQFGTYSWSGERKAYEMALDPAGWVMSVFQTKDEYNSGDCSKGGFLRNDGENFGINNAWIAGGSTAQCIPQSGRDIEFSGDDIFIMGKSISGIPAISIYKYDFNNIEWNNNIAPANNAPVWSHTIGDSSVRLFDGDIALGQDYAYLVYSVSPQTPLLYTWKIARFDKETGAYDSEWVSGSYPGADQSYMTSASSDSDGSIIVSGYHLLAGSANTECHIVKYSSSGEELWSYGWKPSGYGFCYSWSQTIGDDGKIYIAGQAATEGTYNVHGYIAAFSPDGDFIGEHIIDTAQRDTVMRDIHIDHEGMIIAGGYESDGTTPSENRVIARIRMATPLIWGSCESTASPQLEVCDNGIDDDCDGTCDNDGCTCSAANQYCGTQDSSMNGQTLPRDEDCAPICPEPKPQSCSYHAGTCAGFSCELHSGCTGNRCDAGTSWLWDCFGDVRDTPCSVNCYDRNNNNVCDCITTSVSDVAKLSWACTAGTDIGGNNSLDTDGDGILTQYDTETDVNNDCNDGIDNDGDGFCDYFGCRIDDADLPADPDCGGLCDECKLCGQGDFNLCDEDECTLSCSDGSCYYWETGFWPFLIGDCCRDIDDDTYCEDCDDIDGDGFCDDDTNDPFDECIGQDDRIDEDLDGIKDCLDPNPFCNSDGVCQSPIPGTSIDEDCDCADCDDEFECIPAEIELSIYDDDDIGTAYAYSDSGFYAVPEDSKTGDFIRDASCSISWHDGTEAQMVADPAEDYFTGAKEYNESGIYEWEAECSHPSYSQPGDDVIEIDTIQINPNAEIELSDTSNTETRHPFEEVQFFAGYNGLPDENPISGAQCTILHQGETDAEDMVYNPELGIYTSQRTYTATGNFRYDVCCSKERYSEICEISSADIFSNQCFESIIIGENLHAGKAKFVVEQKRGFVLVRKPEYD